MKFVDLDEYNWLKRQKNRLCLLKVLSRIIFQKESLH